MKESIRRKEEGITLVALVVTIIILLILAGVAIASVAGDNGLFRKAKEATDVYKESEENERDLFSAIERELEKAKIDWSKIYDETGYAKETTPITTTEGTYYIPEGFKMAEDSAGVISEGIVVEDKNGNQWVWIPCYVEAGENVKVANRKEEDKSLTEEEYAEKKNIVKYDRYAFSREGYNENQTKLTKEDEAGNEVVDTDEDGSQKIRGTDESYYCHEAKSNEDESSIKKYGGFYIGRYEAGDGTLTNADTPRLRTKDDLQTNTITIKKNQVPYNWIAYGQCVTLSNGIAESNGYNTNKLYTKICSSYAWDTALMFIGSDYATNSRQGNYYDLSFMYEDITKVKQTKNAEEEALIPTGQTISVKNIYDMGGNVWEYTSELCTHNSYPHVLRGGCRAYKVNEGSASFRYRGIGSGFVNDGFRPTLYIK